MEIAEVAAELTPDGQTLILTPSTTAVRTVLPYLKVATPLFKPTEPVGGIQLPLSWAGVVQAARILGKSWQPGPRLCAWVIDELYRRASAGEGTLRVALPAGLEPRPYQVAGARMIATMGRALLFDEQGTGKTITAILGILERQYQLGAPVGVFPALCVVPASVVDSWCVEWRKWAPHLRVLAWRGTAANRRALAAITADVYVCSYDTARMDASNMDGPLIKLRARSVIVDECHMIKTPHAMRSLAARRLARQAVNFVALSGTPITHHPGDLWPTLEGLASNAFPAKERYVTRYCMTLPGDYGDEIIGLRPANEPEFRDALMGQYRRVAKADALPFLPPKVYSVRHVELPTAWRKAYDSMEKRMLAELPDESGELSVMNVLALFTRLSQLASAPADVKVWSEEDVKTGELVEHTRVTLKGPSWKVDALLDVLAERPGQPVLCFTPSAQLARLAGAAAADAAYSVGYIIGGQDAAERTATIEAFQAGKLDLLCATTQSGGVGLTLTAANTVVFLQRPWSLVEALQAEDRAHRIGSEIHESIEIIDVFATNTIDGRVREILHTKGGQLAELLQDRRIVTQLLGGKP